MEIWWRIGVGILLLGHAFVHTVWRTYGPTTSWMLPQAGDILLRSLSTVLFVTAAVGFAPGGRVHGALQLGVVEGIRGPVLGDLPGSTAGVLESWVDGRRGD